MLLVSMAYAQSREECKVTGPVCHTHLHEFGLGFIAEFCLASKVSSYRFLQPRAQAGFLPMEARGGPCKDES